MPEAAYKVSPQNQPTPQEGTMPENVRPCPDGAVLVIKGESFPCDWMGHMAPESDSHEGWAHGNSAAEAIWQ